MDPIIHVLPHTVDMRWQRDRLDQMPGFHLLFDILARTVRLHGINVNVNIAKVSRTLVLLKPPEIRIVLSLKTYTFDDFRAL
jgi:hypothetical protein